MVLLSKTILPYLGGICLFFCLVDLKHALILWYIRKAKHCKRLTKYITVISIIISAAIPVINFIGGSLNLLQISLYTVMITGMAGKWK